MSDAATDLHARLTSVQRALKAPKNQRNNFAGYNYRSCEDILEAVKPLLADHDLTLTISDEIVHFPSAHPTQAQQVKDSKGNLITELVDGDRFYVKATATVRDQDGTETAVSAWARESQNKKGTDDAQITGAASSYARKYALNGLFLIDDTKDADTDEHSRMRPADRTTARGGPGDAAAAPQVTQGDDQAQSPSPRQNVAQRPVQQSTGASGNKRTDLQGKALWKISGANRDVIAGWCAEYGVGSDRDLTEDQAAEIIAKYGS